MFISLNTKIKVNKSGLTEETETKNGRMCYSWKKNKISMDWKKERKIMENEAKQLKSKVNGAP